MKPASTQRHIKPHAIQSEQKQTSEAANSHYAILPPDLSFSLKHFLMTEQTNPIILSVQCLVCVCVCGGRLVIISLSCYSMSQQGARGVGWGPGWKGKGLVGFCWKHNWHGLGDTVRQIVPCLSVCIHRGPCNVSLNKEPRPLKRCLCSLCGSATQQVANLTITAQHRYN